MALKTRLSYATMALLGCSILADLGAYFSDSMFLQMTGMLTVLGAVLTCGLNGLGSLYRLRKKHRAEATQRQSLHSALVSVALIVSVLVIAMWRWVMGPTAASSFDGGYPVLAALTLVLAGYQGWVGTSTRRR